jgi:hypothetical protein
MSRFERHRAQDFLARIANPSVVQAFPATLTFVDVDFAGTTCIARDVAFAVVDRDAAVALPPLHQHFLKQDAVFSHVLVYAG